MTHTAKSQENFRRFLTELTSGDPIELPPWDLSRAELIELLSQAGRIVAIEEQTWWDYLEVLPPRWMNGNAFAFAEGFDRFRLFWKHRGQFFARQLSEMETDRFCQLSGASRSN